MLAEPIGFIVCLRIGPHAITKPEELYTRYSLGMVIGPTPDLVVTLVKTLTVFEFRN